MEKIGRDLDAGQRPAEVLHVRNQPCKERDDVSYMAGELARPAGEATAHTSMAATLRQKKRGRELPEKESGSFTCWVRHMDCLNSPLFRNRGRP